MFDIYNKLKAAFNTTDCEENPHAQTDLFLAHQQLFSALDICLGDLLIDGNIELSRISDNMDADVLNVSKEEITPNFFAEHLMSVENKQATIDNNAHHYYPEALVLYQTGDEAVVGKMFDGDESYIDDISSDDLADLNTEMSRVNDQLHESFCSYMGYSSATVTYEHLFQAVKFAEENNMIEGKSVENWLPIAIANMPTVENNNPVASPKP